jgi:hypothetical protein
MNKILKWFWIVIGILLALFFLLNHPQSLIIPLWIFVFIFREKISKLFNGRFSFLIAGVIFGLIIEIFALLQNMGQPVAVRSITLFHAFAIPDLILGFFYYLVMIGTWFLILRKVNFSSRSVFILAGLFGVVFEQNGIILLGLLAGGLIPAIFVFLVHGIYPMLAHYVTKGTLPHERKEPRWWHYIITLLLLYITWALITGPIFIVLKPLFGG